MAEILLYWGWDADLLECPQYIADDINIYQRQFDKWISNPNNHHSYWTKDSEDELALCFDGTAFLEWLNNIVLANDKEKAHFIKRQFVPVIAELDLPRINF